MRMSRRTFLRATGAAAAVGTAGGVPLRAGAEEATWQHGLAIFGDLKYPAGFPQFDYVNAAAPRGGVARLAVTGTFDNFNLVIAGVKGQIAGGVDLIYETLFAGSLDEESSTYGLVAEAVSYPADRSAVTYRLRREARWHDGMPITPADVIFSFEAFKENSPQLSAYYQHVKKAEQSGERDVTFTFDRGGIREMPYIVGELTVLPKHWYEGKTPRGATRDVTATTLEPPLGSGPYRMKSFAPGSNIVYARVPDYWGRDLPVRVGQQNFDELQLQYFRDTSVAFEAFKADQYDWHVENTARIWATGYDFPAVKDKRVVKDEFPIRNVGSMQGFAFNLRRPKFGDPRVRQAFNYALDFETINAELFFGQYTRIASYFDGTELASSGLPQGLELEILQTVQHEVPPEVFTTPYTNPVGGNDRAMRANLLAASKLFTAAGYTVRNLKLVDARTGQPFTAEFLLSDPIFERSVLFYAEALKRLGVGVSVRTVDDIQYENRLRRFDFDITVQQWTETLTPGNEQRDNWGSRAADTTGSSNLCGIKDNAIDTLVTRVIEAQTREEMTAAVHALDRVLLWHHYVVPQWTIHKARTAWWDRFAHPDKLPEFGISAFPDIWWWDATRAARTAVRKSGL
jgi:microcin C transport system substrate-binding protein